MKQSVTPYDVVELLNDLLLRDQEAVHALCESRVACNDEITHHPTVQVAYREEKDDDGNVTYHECKVGLLGLLNGLFGVYDMHNAPTVETVGFGPIAAIFDDDGKLLRFGMTGQQA